MQQFIQWYKMEPKEYERMWLKKQPYKQETSYDKYIF
jgi:hypothetical protein